MDAMIFAAGLGTRLRPLTDTMPKALVEVGGRPLLCHVMERVAPLCSQVVVNAHHFAGQVSDFLASHYPEAVVSDESDLLRETGGGLRHAAGLLCDDYTLIHNVDILSNTDLRAFCRMDTGADARLLVSERVTQRYLLFDDDMRLAGWTNVVTGEVKSPYGAIDPSRYRRLAFAGIHIISRRLIEEMEEWPERFSIIDYYLAKCSERRIEGYTQPGLRLLDVGKADTLTAAERFLESVEEGDK